MMVANGTNGGGAAQASATSALALPPVALKWFGALFVIVMAVFFVWYLVMRRRQY